MQILSNRAYLVAQVDARNGRFVSKAVVTAEGPEQAVRKVRLLPSKKGEQTTESQRCTQSNWEMCQTRVSSTVALF